MAWLERKYPPHLVACITNVIIRNTSKPNSDSSPTFTSTILQLICLMCFTSNTSWSKSARPLDLPFPIFTPPPPFLSLYTLCFLLQDLATSYSYPHLTLHGPMAPWPHAPCPYASYPMPLSQPNRPTTPKSKRNPTSLLTPRVGCVCVFTLALPYC